MATSKTLLPPPYLTLEDLNGAAIANGTVTFYEAGTAVLAVVYADANGLVISANPLVVDAAGRYTVFLTPGQVVDVTYRDALGALIKTVPGVQAVPSASGNVDTTGTVGEAVTFGQLVFLSDGATGKAAGRWWLATDHQQEGNTLTLGIVLTAAGPGASTTIRTAGRVEGLSGLVVGAQYAVSSTPGALALVPVASVRYVGQADSTTSLVLWPNPPDPNVYVDFVSTAGTITQLVVRGDTALIFGNCTIHGIRKGYHGQRLRLLARSTVNLVHNSPSAVASDRLQNWVTSGPTPMIDRGVADYTWDATKDAWVLTAHEQGGWMTPPFNAADYQGSGGMAWTVEAGDVVLHSYYLQGRALRVQLRIHASGLSGAAASLLVYTLPGGYAQTGNSSGALGIHDGTPNWPAGVWQYKTPTQIAFAKDIPGTLWVLHPSTTYIFADLTLPIA